MPVPLGPILVGALNLLRGSQAVGTLMRAIRVGNRVFKVLDAMHPDNVQVPYIDKAVLMKSLKVIDTEYKKLGVSPNKTAIIHMRREYGGLAGDIASITPPLAKGLTASEKAIDRDVHKIFKPLETLPFGQLVMANNYTAALAYNFEFHTKRLVDAVEANNWQLVHEAFARRGWENKNIKVEVVARPTRQLHNAGMDKNGFVRKKFFISGTKGSAQATIDQYADEVKKTIGKMAGGWVKCYIGLGGTGHSLPAQYAAMGAGDFKVKGGTNPQVSISNRYGNFNGFMKKKNSIITQMYVKRSNAALTSITNDLKKEIAKRRMAP